MSLYRSEGRPRHVTEELFSLAFALHLRFVPDGRAHASVPDGGGRGGERGPVPRFSPRPSAHGGPHPPYILPRPPQGRVYEQSYVPGAKATCDVPQDIIGLLKQRKRWLNGSIFSLFYSYQHSGQLYAGDMPLRRKAAFTVEMVVLALIEIKSPRKCFPLSLIVVDAKADLQTKASNGHGQGLSQKLIGFEPVSPLRASSANKHG